MEIEVKFTDEDNQVNYECFSSYEALGVWVSNNYENKIIEITISEE